MIGWRGKTTRAMVVQILSFSFSMFIDTQNSKSHNNIGLNIDFYIKPSKRISGLYPNMIWYVVPWFLNASADVSAWRVPMGYDCNMIPINPWYWHYYNADGFT